MYGENLVSVYLRGSAPRGLAIDDISDLDFLLFVRNIDKAIKIDFSDCRKKNIKKYSFIEKIENSLVDFPTNNLKDRKILLLLNQSLFLKGEEVKFKRIKVNYKNMSLHLPNINKNLDYYSKWITSKTVSKKNVRLNSNYHSERILRSGLELCINKSGKYTRDLYYCYEIFSELYPEKKDHMYKILELAINQSADKKEIKKIIGDMYDFLIKEKIINKL